MGNFGAHHSEFVVYGCARRTYVVLVATLMAFGKLASQNEITAMKASSMSLYRMMAPVVLASIVLIFF